LLIAIADLLGIFDGMATALRSAMPNEIANELKERTMRFALRVMRLCRALPADWEGRFIADQLFRASARTSANYHAACRARSRRDFINKLGMVVEESDESVFWLAFVGRSALNETAEQKDLLARGRELLAIFIQSAKTASTNNHPQ
jgi:four helix bundle protein